MLPVKNTEIYHTENILSLKKAASLISELKKSGKTVGLCHGGFDLLHPGHIKHLKSAKSLCDILFVSVTSDRFLALSKGIERPILGENLRAYMVSNLKSVDYALVSDYEQGVEVIKSLKPSFYIKGPECINKIAPGIISERQAIKDVGGEMRYTHDHILSTTGIVDYIKRMGK
jgi:rfaE bifunctional protein nucleotidyltransferase chain/domain